MFSVIEIEINSNCNRKCIYCPNSKIGDKDIPLYMENEVQTKIIEELKMLNFTGRLSYHFYNEPLLHPSLENIVKIFSDVLPETRQVLYTNGDFLTDYKYDSLVKNGIQHFIVTQHDSKNISVRPLQTVLMPENLNKTNRGGTLGRLENALASPCFVPSTMIIVTVIGDVLYCYEDAQRKYVMGNVMKNSLKEIWFSKKYNEIRKQLELGNRNINEMCKVCNNTAHPSPGQFDFVY